ncbi:MAG: helix-turn-helix domain-containing protein [Solirubrobacteraceae bacterium]
MRGSCSTRARGALHDFVTQGYDRTSIEDVARAAGVSRPIVYDHHGSKAGLYLTNRRAPAGSRRVARLGNVP